MATKASRQSAATEELQLALVMTGGVSLAIWMGGVTNEIYRLLRKDGLYGELLELTDTEPRIDVISGTSAGGLNGVLLAAAMASDLPVECFEDIRHVWLSAGSLQALLRSPLEKDPPSLLQGDEYFERKIRDVLESWLGNSGLPGEFPESEDFQLRLTGTLLDGEVRAYPDDFGELIHDKKHDVVFRFSRRDIARPTIARELSLAARTSASFPVAFEPSTCPLTQEPKSGGRPDMSNCLSVRTTDDKVAVIDGGVLLNKPLRPALKAIKEAAPLFNSRRVLAYIVPDPAEPADTETIENADETTIWQAIASSVVKIPGNQSIYRDLNEARRYQQRVQDQNRFREQIVRTSATAPLDALAANLYQYYKTNRGDSSVRRSIGFLMSRTLPQGEEPIEDRAGSELVDRFEEIFDEMKEARLSWLPKDAFPDEAYFACDDWPWGIASLEYLITLERDLLKRSSVLLVDQQGTNTHTALDDLTRKLDAESRKVSAIRALDRAYWRGQKEAFWRTAEEFLELDVVSDWAKDAYRNWPIGERGDEVIAAANRVCSEYKLGPDNPCNLTDKKTRLLSVQTARNLAEILSGLRDVTSTVKIPDTEDSWFVHSMLRQLLPAETGEGPGDQVAFTIRKMIALFVVQVAMQGDQEPGAMMKLMQVCANMPTAVDETRSRASQKLTGVQLGHFGALFKPSWRANDFMWGRLDAAERLARMLLEPDRLAELGKSQKDVLAAVKKLATDSCKRTGLSDNDRDHLKGMWTRRSEKAVKAELAFLGDAKKKSARPKSLPKSTQAIAYALQIEILQKELPVVAGAVKQSIEQRANKDSGSAFCDEVETVSASSGSVPASEACRLLGMCRIGEERLADEMGHDLFANTAIEAGAVLTSAAKGTKSGLDGFRGLFRSLYWGVIIPLYSWIRLGTARNRGSRIAATIMSALISASLTILIIRLTLPVEFPWLLLLVAAAILIAWIMGSAYWRWLKRRADGLKGLFVRKV